MQFEYALWISDSTLDTGFGKIYGQNDFMENKTRKIIIRDGVGFRRIDSDLFRFGEELKKRGHLRPASRLYLRTIDASGCWPMKVYVEQWIALIAAEVCQDCVPGRFKKWLSETL